ncbi:hypothetical protein Hanom_Chr02g00139531 [Helianthus anomalus]
MCTDYFDRIAMASSASSGVYDDHAHMDISSNDEPFVEIVSSDDEDLDDFQPFALPGFVQDGEPLVDGVLAVGPQLNQFIIIGHPDGAHIVDYIPPDVVSLAAVPETLSSPTTRMTFPLSMLVILNMISAMERSLTLLF